MARPVYPYEMNDPDFAWLLETFQENHPEYQTVQETCLPIVLISENRKRSGACGLTPEEFIPDNPFEQLLMAGTEPEE